MFFTIVKPAFSDHLYQVTVKPALVTTSIKLVKPALVTISIKLQSNLLLVTTSIKLQSNLLLVTTSIKWVKPTFSDHLY